MKKCNRNAMFVRYFADHSDASFDRLTILPHLNLTYSYRTLIFRVRIYHINSLNVSSCASIIIKSVQFIPRNWANIMNNVVF